MLNSTIRREEALKNLFAKDVSSEEGALIPHAPIRDYCGYLEPAQCESAVRAGDRLVQEMERSRIADFEKNIAYCERTGSDHPDRMVHVSTFRIIGGTIYMTYYANTATEAEDPLYQEARLAFCPVDAPEQMTILTIQKAGEHLDGRLIDRLYDTILLYKGGDELYLLWTASADGLYYRLYCTYNIATRTLSAIRPNRFQVGDVVIVHK